jgi:broad specificity phosphatase PhoE
VTKVLTKVPHTFPLATTTKVSRTLPQAAATARRSTVRRTLSRVVTAGLPIVLACAALVGCAAGPRSASSGVGARGTAGREAGQVTTPRSAPRHAFLVRHAEKDTSVAEDPPLTAAGEARARALADRLADEGIARILASDTRRARDTAAPLAARLGLQVQLYDPARLEDLAGELLWLRDNVLVVGHSNTTGELAGLLGGDPGPPIREADEYDRLYRVDLETGATAIERF